MYTQGELYTHSSRLYPVLALLYAGPLFVQYFGHNGFN